LKAATIFVARYRPVGWPFLPKVLATAFLTGGRASEVLALAVNEVSLDKETVWFRWKGERRLKNPKSDRILRLWPQLKEHLEPYLTAPTAPTGFLFPNVVNGEERRLTPGNPRWRRQLDAFADFIDWKPSHPLEPDKIRLQPCRNAFAAQRLQCLENGQPIAKYTVQREMGHSNTDTLDRIYAHLGQVRHRSELLEFRVEHYEKQIGKRLKALRR
jgi:integrase